MSPIQKAWSYILVTPPANLAVSLDEVKEWLKVTEAVLDDEITALIKQMKVQPMSGMVDKEKMRTWVSLTE